MEKTSKSTFAKLLGRRNRSNIDLEKREKASLQDLIDREVTITDFFITTNENDEKYSIFIVKEEKKKWYYANTILLGIFEEIEENNLKDDVIDEGLIIKPFKATSKKSKRDYVGIDILN